MKKILQKSLASMVSAALCLTAFVGCLTVNAATTYQGTITSDGAEVSETAESATVTLNISSPNAAMNIAAIAATTDFGTLTAVEVEGTNCKIDETKDLAKGRFYVDAIDNVAGFNTAAVKLTFTKAENVAVGNYPVTITYFAKESAATWNEDIVNLVVTGDINITVTSGHTHTWEVVEATPATASSTGSLTRTCSECGQSETVGVSYYARYISNSINASYASAITLEFNSRDDRLTEQGAYSNAFIRFEHNVNGAIAPKITYQSFDDSYPTTKSGRACTTWAYKLKSTQLTETITSNVFVEVNGVWYNGDVRGDSVRSYADGIIAGVAESEQKLIVNMLRYGSKMQQFKGYNTANLADANLGAYEALITTTDPSIVDSSSKANDSTTGIYITSKYYLDMASRTEAVLYARSDKYTGANKDNFTIVASWTNAKGGALTRTYYNATYAAEGSLVYQNELNADNTLKENRYYFSFAELNSYDLRQPVTFYIYDGETEVSQVYTTSIESLVAIGKADGVYGADEIAVYKAMLNYCDASRAHFCQ